MNAIFLLYISSLVWSANSVVLQNIEKKIEGGKTVVEYNFNDRIDSRKVGVEFINHTLQLDVPQAYIEEKKRFTSVEDDKIKSLYSYQADQNTLRLRIIYNEIQSDTLEGKIVTTFTGNVMRVTIDDGRVPMKDIATALPVKVEAPTIQVEDIIVSDGENSVEKEAVAVSVDVEQETAADMKTKASYDEASIPVFTKNVEADKAVKESKMSNFAMAFGIVFLAIIGLFLILRKWSKVKYANPHTNIKVLTQHHLGPKKSLAIVSVAGEFILIGVTDSNINLIKSLSLLDEDIPKDMPSSFNTAFNDAEDKIENNEDGLEVDTFNVMGIKDVVKSRLQNMREL